LAIGLAGLIFIRSVSATVPGTNTLVSANNTGNGQGGDGNTNPGGQWKDPHISADGKFVVFQSSASNMVDNDTNGIADIFVRNLSTGTTTRVDVSSSGVEASSASGTCTSNSSVDAISRTGRYVAFASNSTNLIDGQTTSSWQIFIRDMQTGQTSLVTQTSSGTIANSLSCEVDGVSSDGRFVLFESSATNLGPSVASGGDYLFMADRQLGTFRVLNNSISPIPFQRGHVLVASMSCDGSFVVDTEFQDALTADDTNTFENVYLIDLRNGQTITNLTANEIKPSFEASISCNGDYIAFESESGHTFVPGLIGSTDYTAHFYVYDRINGAFSLADQSSSGTVGNNQVYGIAGVDDNGDTVFESSATNLGSASSPSNEVWFHNNLNGTTELLSRNSAGTAGNGGSTDPGISANGKIATYNSEATNLISSDTNGKRDVFTSLTGL